MHGWLAMPHTLQAATQQLHLLGHGRHEVRTRELRLIHSNLHCSPA